VFGVQVLLSFQYSCALEPAFKTFWGDTIKLHQAVATLSPKKVLALGLKVDADALPANLRDQLKNGALNLDDPANAAALLKLNAVVVLTGFFDASGNLNSIGTQCALCHSAVDNSLAPDIGKRLDGWANSDLNIGAIAASAPDLRLNRDDARSRSGCGSQSAE
jgi:hypothetical protein